jgi:hypothetical protein
VFYSIKAVEILTMTYSIPYDKLTPKQQASARGVYLGFRSLFGRYTVEEIRWVPFSNDPDSVGCYQLPRAANGALLPPRDGG